MSSPESRRPARPWWVGAIFVGAILLAALVATRACQEEELRVDRDQAVQIARERVDFEPERTGVRVIRRGIPSRAYYAISMSAGRQGEPDAHLTTVLIDARSGTVTEVTRNY